MSIGPTEIVVVLVIALLVFGPNKLPQIGRTLGRGIREFKRAAETAKDELGLGEVLDEVNAVKDDVTSSLGVDDIKESLAEATSPITEAKRGVTAAIDDVRKSVGADELAAGVGAIKATTTFDPKTAAKSLLKSRPSSAAEEEAAAGEAPLALDQELAGVAAPAPGEA